MKKRKKQWSLTLNGNSLYHQNQEQIPWTFIVIPNLIESFHSCFTSHSLTQHYY